PSPSEMSQDRSGHSAWRKLTCCAGVRNRRTQGSPPLLWWKRPPCPILVPRERRPIMELTGIHHLTAITANAPGNKRFYTDTLGLRLVKKTVNQDDTSAYHLFYADGLARPGTDLTFFDWPAASERRGTHSISRTGLRVAGDSLDFWAGRLADRGLSLGQIASLDGRAS